MTRTIATITESASEKISAVVLIDIQDDAVTATDWERGTILHQARKQSLMPEIAGVAVSTGLRYNTALFKNTVPRGSVESTSLTIKKN